MFLNEKQKPCFQIIIVYPYEIKLEKNGMIFTHSQTWIYFTHNWQIKKYLL